MPGLGTPFNSFILPYPIRVDAFTSIPDEPPTPHQPTQPKLHLLTHTHSDHITGLQAKSFAQTIYCSADAKSMLLRHQVGAERALTSAGMRAEQQRTYAHLKVDPFVGPNREVYYEGSRDLLRPLRANEPTEIELNANENGKLWITAFDANHCPGSLMYLVEGSEGAVLHTGDFRAEPWFLESLKRNPFLQPYLACDTRNDSNDGHERGVTKTLEAIYLDTACVLQTHQVPTKEHATTGLISLLSMFPSNTKFFLNTWTWGYEDILKAISRHFNCRVHLDSYKYDVFKRLKGDPLLSSLGTRDETESRFHSCERFERCSQVAFGDTEVVYVNPVSSMTPQGWESYLEVTKTRILENPRLVTCLLVPLSRHSPLPELQAFVSLFRPKRVIPNTLEPAMKNVDWAAIDRVFEPCLRSSGIKSKIPPTPQPKTELVQQVLKEEKMKRRLKEKERAQQRLTRNQPSSHDNSESEDDEEEEDVAIKNIVVASALATNESLDDADAQGSHRGVSASTSEDRAKAGKKLAKKWVVRTGESSHDGGKGKQKSTRKKGRMERRLGVLLEWLRIDEKELGSQHVRHTDDVKTTGVTVDMGPGLHTHHKDDATRSSRLPQNRNRERAELGSKNEERERAEMSSPKQRPAPTANYHAVGAASVPHLLDSPMRRSDPIYKRASGSKSFLRSSSPMPESQSSEMSLLSNESSDDEADERGRTAHYLFFNGEDHERGSQHPSSDSFNGDLVDAQAEGTTPRRGCMSSASASPKTPTARTRRGHHLDPQLTPNSSPVTKRRVSALNRPDPSLLHVQGRSFPVTPPPKQKSLSKSVPSARSPIQNLRKEPSIIDLTTLPSSPATPPISRHIKGRGTEISSINPHKRPATASGAGALVAASGQSTKRRRLENEFDPSGSKSSVKSLIGSNPNRDLESRENENHHEPEGTGASKGWRPAGTLTEVQNFIDQPKNQLDGQEVQSDPSLRGERGKERETEPGILQGRQLQQTPTQVFDKTTLETFDRYETTSVVSSSSARKRKRSPSSRLRSHSTQLAIMNQMAIARPVGQSPTFASAHAELEKKHAREVQKEIKMKEYQDGMLALKKKNIEKWGQVCDDLERKEVENDKDAKRLERSERSLMLEEKVREDARQGRRVVLPRMRCTMTESQLLEDQS